MKWSAVRGAAAVVASGLALWPASAVAAPMDSVTGHVETQSLAYPGVDTAFWITARSGPSGESPSGKVKIDIDTTGLPFSGVAVRARANVTCLHVAGSLALVSAQLDEPVAMTFTGGVPAPILAQSVQLVIRDDFVEPGDVTQTKIDEVLYGFSAEPSLSAGDQLCNDRQTQGILGRALGNLNVRDAQP